MPVFFPGPSGGFTSASCRTARLGVKCKGFAAVNFKFQDYTCFADFLLGGCGQIPNRRPRVPDLECVMASFGEATGARSFKANVAI